MPLTRPERELGACDPFGELLAVASRHHRVGCAFKDPDGSLDRIEVHTPLARNGAVVVDDAAGALEERLGEEGHRLGG
jgi:hypothetical protein